MGQVEIKQRLDILDAMNQRLDEKINARLDTLDETCSATVPSPEPPIPTPPTPTPMPDACMGPCCNIYDGTWVNIRELSPPQWCFARSAVQCEKSYTRPANKPESVKMCKLAANSNCGTGGPTYNCAEN